ncbi:MAG: alpha/beta hydrolase [Candidatus Nanopelagicales bacterium]
MGKVVKALVVTTAVTAAAAAAAVAAAPKVQRQKRMVDGLDPQFRVPMAYLPLSFNPTVVKLYRQAPAPSVDLGDVALDVRTLPPAGGLDGVDVRIYEPPGRADGSPAVLFIHGGGYVIGSAAGDDALCADLARQLGALVVSVEYRLAPEHPFPAPHEDCLRALRWMHAEADALRIDPARIAVSGESAGGGLAAGLVQRAVDDGIPVAFQHLIYPMLDDRTVQRAEAGDAWHAVWTPPSNRYGWASYLGTEPGGDIVPPYAVPSRRASLAGLPPTWIGVGSADLFHDEDVAYAEALREAGVPCTLHVTPGMPHAGQRFAVEAPASQAFERSGLEALARGLGVDI